MENRDQYHNQCAEMNDKPNVKLFHSVHSGYTFVFSFYLPMSQIAMIKMCFLESVKQNSTSRHPEAKITIVFSLLRPSFSSLIT